MEFIDLAAQQKRIKAAIEERMQAVLDHGRYIMGPEVQTLEERLSEYAGTKHGIGCASGTDALLLALMARGVGPEDAIFTSPFTFVATAEVIALLRATPVFVDIDPATFNMDPDRLEMAVEALKTKDASLHPLPRLKEGLTPRGIIAVDMFGLPADYKRIRSIAEMHDLFLVEDAAQSFGATYEGRKTCSLAQIGCTSFFPAKPLGGYGDGGMCFTDHDELAAAMRSLRVHGQGSDKYDNVRIGINGRLDTLQAAVLMAKFEIFPEELELRQHVARRYSELLDQPRSPVTAPKIPKGCTSAWSQYSVLARNQKERSTLLGNLKEAGIPTAVYYPKPLHLQTAFSYLGYREGDFPMSEDCSRRVFSLPMHPYLKREDQEAIAEALISPA